LPRRLSSWRLGAVGDAAIAERWAVRIVVPAALLCAALAAILLPHAQPLPAVALGSRWILYALRALALFYGFLLLFVPLVRSLRGLLPIELSMRGARWEETGGSATVALDALDERLSVLERQRIELSERLDGAVERIAASRTEGAS
jgi:hypothetical protein